MFLFYFYVSFGKLQDLDGLFMMKKWCQIGNWNVLKSIFIISSLTKILIFFTQIYYNCEKYIIRYNSPCLRVSVGGLYKLDNCSVRLYNLLRNYNRNYIIDLDYYIPNISDILRLPKRYIIELNIYIISYNAII